jgi:Ala-tRNA(Pro) deacylase
MYEEIARPIKEATMSAQRVRAYLLEHGLQYQLETHPVVYTTSEVAEAEHVPGKQMAKAVMLMADDHLMMAVLSGDQMVDLAKAKAALGVGTLRLATEGEFWRSFPDCDRGAEPPFGALYDIATVVDRGLAGPEITFNAGTHTESITMALADYLELTNPQIVDLAVTA